MYRIEVLLRVEEQEGWGGNEEICLLRSDFNLVGSLSFKKFDSNLMRDEYGLEDPEA